MSDQNTERRTIAAGAVVHIDGIPIQACEPFEAETHPGNWGLTAPDHIMPPITDHGPLETMARELAPCPFCGSDEFLMLSNSLLGVHSFWQVECGCHASGAPEILRENAIKVWNTRPPTVPRKLYDAIGGLVSECADQRDIYPDAATAVEAITSTVNEIYACMEGGVFGPIDSEKGE